MMFHQRNPRHLRPESQGRYGQMHLEYTDLISYTDWERRKWYDWFRRHETSVLNMSAGPHGDGRFQTIGDLVRHIFMAEKRYVERLTGRPLTDMASISSDNLEALFEFGQQSRREFIELLETFPAAELDTMRELKFPMGTVKATPRKIVTHVLSHEIRHWAQIMTMLRWAGLTEEFHDFLFSPVMGGERMHT
jgi:uncharacterized damage-inducible protein DinB